MTRSGAVRLAVVADRDTGQGRARILADHAEDVELRRTSTRISLLNTYGLAVARLRMKYAGTSKLGSSGVGWWGRFEDQALLAAQAVAG